MNLNSVTTILDVPWPVYPTGLWFLLLGARLWVGTVRYLDEFRTADRLLRLSAVLLGLVWLSCLR